jgi:hypothetical protein
MKSTKKEGRQVKQPDVREPHAAVPLLSAENLKNALWETLHAVKNGEILPGQGDAIASQAREILRTVKIQLQIAGQAKRRVPTDVVDFAEQALLVAPEYAAE